MGLCSKWSKKMKHTRAKVSDWIGCKTDAQFSPMWKDSRQPHVVYIDSSRIKNVRKRTSNAIKNIYKWSKRGAWNWDESTIPVATVEKTRGVPVAFDFLFRWGEMLPSLWESDKSVAISSYSPFLWNWTWCPIYDFSVKLFLSAHS
jgi:hypothetical protein